jgi:cytochrome c-type biogenesis protein CcmE
MERRSRVKLVVGGLLILLGIGGLAAWALASPGSVSYYTTPSELRSQALPASGRTFRLGGRVATDGFERRGSLVTFTVTDDHQTVPVVYRGEVPDTLKPDTDVIAEGRFGADGVLHADRVLAKCSSKFVSKDEAPEHLGRMAG